MAYIDLSGKRGKGKRTLVDQDIADRYGGLSWFLSDTGYAMRRSDKLDDGTKVTIRLHRLVTQAPEGMVVDHKNGDPLDNRRSNLRVVTQAENARNHHGTVGYCWDKTKNKWMVRYRNKYYGRYETESEAIRAYQLAKSGVPYQTKRRKLWHLPTGVTKQFGKYKVRPTRNRVKHWIGAFETVDEAKSALDAFNAGTPIEQLRPEHLAPRRRNRKRRSQFTASLSHDSAKDQSGRLAWRVRWRESSGKNRSKYFSTQQEGESYMNQLNNEQDAA